MIPPHTVVCPGRHLNQCCTRHGAAVAHPRAVAGAAQTIHSQLKRRAPRERPRVKT